MMSYVCCFEFAATSFFFLKHFKICLCWNLLAADPQNIPLTLLLVKVSHPKCLLNPLISPSLHVLTLLLPSCLNVLFLSVFAPSAQPRQHELFHLLLYMLFYHFSFFIMGDFFELVLVLILVESVITYNFLYKLVPCRMYLSIYLSVCLVLICICWNCWFSLFILCFLSVKFTCVQCVSFGFDSLLVLFLWSSSVSHV